MSWEPKQLPDVTPESREYWAAAADGTLKIKECEACGSRFHYPRTLCPDCLGDTKWIETDGTGEIYAYSSSMRTQSWPEEELPHVIAYVELDEGPKMISVIDVSDPELVDIGTRVEVEFRATQQDDVAIPVFVPVE